MIENYMVIDCRLRDVQSRPPQGSTDRTSDRNRTRRRARVLLEIKTIAYNESRELAKAIKRIAKM